MPLAIESVTIPFTEVGRVEKLESDLETLQGQIGQFEVSHEMLVKQRDALIIERDDANLSLAKAVSVNRELNTQLQARPVSTIKRAPVITRNELRNVAGVTIENSLTDPNEDQYDRVRLFLMLIAGMGLNTARWYMGPGEVKKHLTLPDTSPSHLPKFAESLGITYGADTVDRVVWDTLKAEDAATDLTVKATLASNLKAYLEGLGKWAKFFYFNDANQYRSAAYAKGTLERMVKRVREIVPDMPLIASLTANALIDDYSMFDFQEAQTFGTTNDFKLFINRPFDVFCIDGRPRATKLYLQQITQMMLAKNTPNFFFYPTIVTDWIAMPAQIGVIREFVAKWKALA